MLMMVDPNVIYVLPRYSGTRSWTGQRSPTAGWPGPPRLDRGALTARRSGAVTELCLTFR